MAGHTLSLNSEIDPRYLCSLCGNILKDPVQTGCGHVYCNSCIQDLKSLLVGWSDCMTDGRTDGFNYHITPCPIDN